MSDTSGAQPLMPTMPYEVYRSQRAVEARMEAVEMKMDETEPGGRYLIGDQMVDAAGKPVGKDDAQPINRPELYRPESAEDDRKPVVENTEKPAVEAEQPVRRGR